MNMSIAAIRSSRGDIYQRFVAFDWALIVLTDPDYQSLEIDSPTHFVDDVVIAKSDGSHICCQCKKNQTDFRAWSISDLEDELDKSIQELARNQQTQIRFYSRCNFGSLAKLKEFAAAYSNELDYRRYMTGEHSKTDAELNALISTKPIGLSTFEFLRQIYFEVTPDYDRLEMLLRERLRQMASNSNTAYDALWRRLDEHGGRTRTCNLSASAQHRLTKENLMDLLHQAGSMLVPTMSLVEIRRLFASTSTIGRSWVRDIGGLHFPSPLVGNLLAAIDAGMRSVLVTGSPGSGKTCVMLSLQETLEQRAQVHSDLVPVFIQSREFADFATAQERQAQGLPELWVEKAARLAEDTRVIVVIDSLDVLSIAREHSVLTYFLAQIDQLLLIPNVAVVTACRDFDRKYDRRIAARHWDGEFQCQPFDWETEIAPLLQNLGIDTTIIDSVTRELIRNPRELAIFVELAEREGSFNAVTGQALAEQYLDAIVVADHALGDTAMQALEFIAETMLQSRSLSIPHQTFRASEDILRRLRSLNILQDSHDGKLTFGHQTLLDVLVISGAIRRGVSLNTFIQGLPPVPFVRPSIRSFVAQLAMGERHKFRKQLRAVLAGKVAFHIRRLVAESFAQQIPQEDDWQLIKYLRDQHREIFQVIYTQASSLEWHHLWLNYLIPALLESRDADGLAAHIPRVTQWVNTDAKGVLTFWEQTLSLNWIDSGRISGQLSHSLAVIKEEHLSLVEPLLDRLLNMPNLEHSVLGATVARCVRAGVADDDLLWRFIIGNITDEDITKLSFGNKLHCESNDFGDSNASFLKQRMVDSTALLDLAVEAIENWSYIKSTQNCDTRIGYRYGFLGDTSYNDAHSKTEHRFFDDLRALFDAVEEAIIEHAHQHSVWWQLNRERLCSSHEGALCYFAVRALTKSPETNLTLITKMLCDLNLLEFSLDYEIGSLIQNAFIYLDGEAQDSVMSAIHQVWTEQETRDDKIYWQLKEQVQYVSAIPCHLRSEECQAKLAKYESIYGPFLREPSIFMRSGYVAAPFSYEVFLITGDDGVLRLLEHYSDDNRRGYDDYLIGGQEEVGSQLHEASSRQPQRFLRLLSVNGGDLAAPFRNAIMDGVATYLAHRYGSLQTNSAWDPIEVPDCELLANQILDELEKNIHHWYQTRSLAKALEACANVIQAPSDANRLVLLADQFLCIREDSSINGETVDLITIGFNMKLGNVAEALMILINNFHERETAIPEILVSTLRNLALNEYPAIRALILRRLPYLQSKNPELGWELFDLVMQDAVGLWRSAELCLYYAYYNSYEIVEHSLDRIFSDGNNEDKETWGRITALCAMTGHVSFTEFLDNLDSLDITKAWFGAASVWTHSGNLIQHREQCLAGIKAGLHAKPPHAIAVANCISNLFRENTPPVVIPIDLIHLCFTVFESVGDDKHRNLFDFGEWLNTTSQRDPDIALAATEIYLTYASRTNTYLYDHNDQLVQLVTRLFAEADEREESDNGEMLKRVVSVQDMMLSLGVNSINDWLKTAERQ